MRNRVSNSFFIKYKSLSSVQYGSLTITQEKDCEENHSYTKKIPISSMEESRCKSSSISTRQHLNLLISYSPTTTERSAVLIASPEEEWRVRKRCQKLVASKTKRPDILCQTDSRNCSFHARKTSSFSSWTTELIAEKLLKEFHLVRDLGSWPEPRNWMSDSPTLKLRPRRSQLNERD